MSDVQMPSMPPVPPRTKPKRWPWILGIVAALFVGIGIGAVGSTTTDKQAELSSPTPTETSEAPSPSPSPQPETFRLTKNDIELSLKTTSKQCFGSAGCNVTVEVRAAVDKAMFASAPPDGQWDVTYQITGDESGPLIGTFGLYGNGKYDVNEEFLTTASTNTPVRVKIIDVESSG